MSAVNYQQIGSAKLTERARTYLKDRDIPLANAKRANVRSLTPTETFSVFRCKRESLLLPVDSDYGIARVFDLPPDQGKFRTPLGPLRLYEPPPPPKMTIERIRSDVSVPLFKVEGPFKALATSCHGFPSVGFNGCWGWQKRRRPIPDLKKYKYPGRRVTVFVDADADDNQSVTMSLFAHLDWLDEQGALVYLPELPKVAGRTTGIDDFIACQGAKAVTALPLHQLDSEYARALREKIAPFTDGGNATRLLHRHGEDLLHDPVSRKWFVWNGQRWGGQPSTIPDVQERMRETVAAISHQADRERNDACRTALRRHAAKSDSAKAIRDAISLAASSPDIRVALDDFDRAPMLLGVKNGTVDLHAGRLLPFASEHLITKCAGVAYDESATAPRWLAFLDRVMAGNAERMAFLQRLAGYCLTGSNPERRVFFLIGEGANGKSIFIERLLHLVGDYGTPTKAEILMQARRDADPERPTPFLNDLRGARLVTVSEVAEGSRLNESLIKDLTGGDVITSRGLKSNPVRFSPGFKVLVRGNHRPIVHGDDEAIWDRLVLVPFEVRIPEPERDPKLAAILDAELPGILNWALAGCAAYQRNGLLIPSHVRSASRTYREEMDTFGRWLEEQTTTTPASGKTMARELQAALLGNYADWCKTGSSQPIGDRRFYAKLDERGIERKKLNGLRYCVGSYNRIWWMS